MENGYTKYRWDYDIVNTIYNNATTEILNSCSIYIYICVYFYIIYTYGKKKIIILGLT